MVEKAAGLMYKHFAEVCRQAIAGCSSSLVHEETVEPSFEVFWEVRVSISPAFQTRDQFQFITSVGSLGHVSDMLLENKWR